MAAYTYKKKCKTTWDDRSDGRVDKNKTNHPISSKSHPSATAK